MNRERAKELLPIIQAFADGKDIQYQTFGMTGWTTMHDHGETFEASGNYRIKPEPREFWIHENMDQVMAVTGTPHGWKPVPCDKYIKVREVIE